MRSYRGEVKQICSYIGNVKLGALMVTDVNGWMRDMTKDGYAPKSVANLFRLLKQALKWGMSQDLVTKTSATTASRPSASRPP